MRLIKIALGSVGPTVGAVEGNAELVLAAARAMAGEEVTIGCFPELVLAGYPPEDLVQWRAFLAAQRRALERLASQTAELPTVLVLGLATPASGQIYNCAAVLHGGRVLGLVPKEKLPTYDVFYEARTFSRGGAGLSLDADGVALGDLVFGFDFGTLAVEVCEDAWTPDGPMRRRCFSGAEVVVNLSSSPFRMGIQRTRHEMLATRSADNQAVVAYVNNCGAQDGLIFDGGGFVFQNGRLVLEGARFEPGTQACVVDLDRTRLLRWQNTTWRRDCEIFLAERSRVPTVESAAPTARPREYPAPDGASFFLPPPGPPPPPARESALDELYEALALGVAGYFEKAGAFRVLGVALSGGRDSMLTLLVAWRAAQRLTTGAPDKEPSRSPAELLQAFYMPSRYSEAGTRQAAETICHELGVELTVVPIDEALDRELEAVREMLGGDEPDALTRQNVQARIRAARMWNWSNSAGGLFLQTGDMSEKAVGYTTIGGDLEGALAVLANVPKTVVIALLERLHQRFGWQGVAACRATEPGPELAAEQTAEGELMPFPVLDACLRLYAGDRLSPAEVERALGTLFPDHPPERLAAWARRFVTLFNRSIYKWVQSPLSLHVGSLDLERERALQLPVLQRNEWDDEPASRPERKDR
ncbi:MAG: NAD(+) synthase [Thermoanaerobaculia bacterium]